MARPKIKEEDRRKRWDAFYFTDAERTELRTAAEAASLSVSRYFVELHRSKKIGRSPNNTSCMTALLQAEEKLGSLLQLLRNAPPSFDSVHLHAGLLNIERGLRQEASSSTKSQTPKDVLEN